MMTLRPGLTNTEPMPERQLHNQEGNKMLYALIMWVTIGSLNQYKPIVVPGFNSAQSCNASAIAIIGELRKSAGASAATETHTCAPNFSAS